MTLAPVTVAAPSAKVPEETILANIDKTFQEKETPVFKHEYKAKPNLLVVQRSTKISAPRLSEQEAFNQLVGKESGNDPLAVNRRSFACGIPQALPCDKLLDYAKIEHPVITSYALAKQYVALVPKEVQLEWMREYIKNRYGNANNALTHHRIYGWY